MKVFTAITLVVLLCCLEVALSFPKPNDGERPRIAAKPQGIAGMPRRDPAAVLQELARKRQEGKTERLAQMAKNGHQRARTQQTGN